MTRKARARAKIRSHLVSKGDSANFTVTQTLVLYWWRELNAALFNNVLEQPRDIIVKKYFHDDTLGWCEGFGYSKKRPVVYGMQEDYDSKELFIHILAHEMVHHWEQQTFGRMSHGKNFFSWKEKFKKLGIPLEVRY